MLEVTFYRDDRDRWCGLLAYGHTDFAARGTDIVCAAVSAILQAARLGLTQYVGAGLAARQEPGELGLDWGEDQCALESVQAIVTTAQLAIDRIARRFPEHVRLKLTRSPHMVGGKASDRVTQS